MSLEIDLPQLAAIEKKLDAIMQRLDAKAAADSPGELLSTKEAATLLGVTSQTLSNWRSSGMRGPMFAKVAHKVAYRRSDIEAWLSANSRGERND